jgi:hypothetical protein
MTAPTENIVQAEFFHVGGKGVTSLDQLLKQIRERVNENFEFVLATGKEMSPGIKTGVRFYDVDGAVTRYAQYAQKFNDAYYDTMGILGTTKLNSWRQRWHGRRLSRLYRKKECTKNSAIHFTTRAFCSALKAKRPVAVERNDHSFRLIRADEVHELAEAVEIAPHAWIFIFRPNDLLADTNTVVARVM